MEPQAVVNWTITMHPCYKIANLSYVLSSTPSRICILIYSFFVSLSVITICGNFLVIISIIYFKQLHTPTNSLILSLAVADLLVGIIVFPFSMAFSLSSCLYHDGLFCKVRDGFDVTLSTSSILNLCCISIDRYYAVCHPLTYRTKINCRAAMIMILVSWSSSVLVATGLVMAALQQDKCQEGCLVEVLLATTIGIVFTYLPLVIMLCIYLKILFVSHRQARSIQNTTKPGATVSKMERKATKTLALIMGVFLICWTPFFLYITVNSASNYAVSFTIIETLNWLAMSNSMLNPFIYAFFYSWFRTAFRMIISGKIFKGDFVNSKLQ